MEPIIITGIVLCLTGFIFWIYLIYKARDINHILDENARMIIETARVNGELSSIKEYLENPKDATPEQQIYNLKSFYGIK